jgi:peptidoglycan/xylan/chitin deacetylase (PgdA/CDA1 family)
MGSGSLDRRDALRLGAALAIAAPLAGCADDAGGWHRAPAAAGSGTASSPVPGANGTGPSGAAATGQPDAGPSLGPLPPEVTQGPADRNAVALTFHGQGDVAIAEALLKELEDGGARATVLAVGSWLAAQPAMAKRILDGGHELGNHTQNHADISHMSADAAYAEINSCAELLNRLTGSIGTWFRPSQTQFSTPTIRSEATRVGYRTCLSYSLDSLDYTDPGAAAIVRNVTTAIQKGSIVSLHFGHAGTVTAIPQILDALRGRGLRAVTMTELMSR